MLFNSFEYLLFLPIVFCLYWFVFKSLRLQNILLLAASYFFYGCWSFQLLWLLVISTLVDYLYGFGVASSNRKRAKLFFCLSIANNLGILGVFKYYNFFITQFQHAFAVIGIHTNPVLLQMVLPVGISFYTFHNMSYIIDIYRGRQKPILSFIDYAVFVSFFPLLVAGPIERAHNLLPQVQNNRFFNYPMAVEGCRLILWGMFKKVVIADNLAEIADKIFGNYQHYNSAALLMGAVAFSFQIYCDFSGYSDIALGTANLFGFNLTSNFKFPYFSRNIAEFWKRWHVSLSSWFRDYLYIPLGGSKHGRAKTIRNVFIVFLLSGFWHGANWNFIVWGFVHACGFLILWIGSYSEYTNKVVAHDRWLPSLKEFRQMGFTFAFITLAWIFFRADNIHAAIDYLKRIVLDAYDHPGQFLSTPSGIVALLYIIPFVFLDWYLRRNERVLRVPENKYIVQFVYCLIFFLTISSIDKKTTFIYFQF